MLYITSGTQFVYRQVSLLPTEEDDEMSSSQSSANELCKWTEHKLGVLHHILNKGEGFVTSELVGTVLRRLDTLTDTFGDNVKFGNLLFVLVSKHGQQVVPHMNTFTQIASRCNSFMATAAVQKLEEMMESMG